MDMKELLGALTAGRVLEVFGAGTACVVCPVGSLMYKDKVGWSSPFTWSPRCSVFFNAAVLTQHSRVLMSDLKTKY